MSRATCKTPERLTSANQPRREEVQPAQGRGRAGGGSARAGKHSLEPERLVRHQVNASHLKQELDDDAQDEASEGKGVFHGSLSRDEVVKARSNASHDISSNSDEAKGHGEDLA